jgi:hypothetical protein
MTNLFRNIGIGALMITGLVTSDASAQQTQKARPQPLTEMRTGVPATTIRAGTSLKVGPTIVPVVDSNAILNLDYKEMRSTPAVAAKPVVAVKSVVQEPTLAELKLQLKVANDEYKAAKLAYTQAVRAKDKTRIAAAKVNRAAAQQKVTDLKKAIAAKQPVVKAKKRATPKKKSGGAAANASVGATTK